MEFFRPPQGLSFEGNVAEKWRRFKQAFEIYMKASGNDKKDPDVKIAIFLSAAGEEAIEVYNTFMLTDEERNNYEKVIEQFELFTTPKKNIVVERFLFNKRKQEEGELFDAFVTDLKKLVKSCEYGDQSDSVVRDRIVLGVSDINLQERLLREADLSLTKAIELGKAAELSRERTLTIQGQSVDYVRKGASKYKPAPQSTAVVENRDARKYRLQKSDENRDGGTSSCQKCKQRHRNGQCPAYGKQCFKCSNFNHFSAACRFKRVQDVHFNDEKSANYESDNEFVVNSLNALKHVDSASSQREWTKTLLINGVNVTFKLDTGAEVNILPLNVFNSINSECNINKCNIILEAFGGNRVKPVGSVNLQCATNEKSYKIQFIVVPNEHARPLLGLDSCIKLDLIIA